MDFLSFLAMGVGFVFLVAFLGFLYLKVTKQQVKVLLLPEDD